jgi:imidazolonepropionase-like amidohydrolase
MSAPVSILARLFTLVAGLAACGAAVAAPSPAKAEGGYAIVNVSVLPMRSDGTLAKQTVIIRGDRIVKIGPARTVKVGRGVTVIDGKGRYLMPGLADMHVHLWDERELPLFVANGVTFVRNMWGEKTTLEMRRRIMAGELTGPTILTAGPLIDGEPRIWAGSARAVTPAEGEVLVAAHKAAGYDFIKVYSNLKAEVFDAIAAAAKRNDIPFEGHVPRAVPLDHALRSGMVTIEHMTGYLEASLAGGRSVGANGRSPEGLALARSVAAGDARESDVFDAEKLGAMAELTREKGVWNVPTLLVLKNSALTRAEVREAMRRDELRYVSPSMQMGWNRASRSDDDQRAQKVFGEQRARAQVAALRRAGAPIMVGTDTPNPQIIHGFAVHEEMKLLEEAGLTRYEVLRAATANPAVFVGTPDAFGVVAEGARADLLLLDANPLDDLANLKRRTGVMLRGRWLPEGELQAALGKVADQYRAAPDWFADAAPLALPGGNPLKFVTRFADKPIAADRLAVAASAGGGRAIVAQTRTTGRSSGLRDYRIGVDAVGALVDYAFDEHWQFGRKGTLTRDGNRWRLAVAGKDDQVIEAAPGEMMLTDTIADGALLAPAVADMPVGASRTLGLWIPATSRSGLALQRQRWTVVRRGAAEAGGRVFDIRIEGDGPARTIAMWIDVGTRLPVRREEADGLRVQSRADQDGRAAGASGL